MKKGKNRGFYGETQDEETSLFLMVVDLDKLMKYQIKRERNLCKFIILKLLIVYLFICKSYNVCILPLN